MGIAEREIKAQRSPDQDITRNRKPRGIQPKTTGEWIRFRRIERGLTQRQLAQATGLPTKHLQKIEASLTVLSPDNMAAIKRVLEISETACNYPVEQ